MSSSQLTTLSKENADPGVSVAILAGGRSERMGQDKAFIKVGNRPVIERILATVKPLTVDILISTNTPQPYARFGLRCVADIYPNKAALSGIYSALDAARHPHVLVVACDMPFPNIALLQYLIALAPTADAIVPQVDPLGPETLHAVYSKACLPAIKSRLLANQLRIIDFFDDVSVRYVLRDEVAQFDPQLYAFINLNTPEDLQKAQSIAADSHQPDQKQASSRQIK